MLQFGPVLERSLYGMLVLFLSLWILSSDTSRFRAGSSLFSSDQLTSAGGTQDLSLNDERRASNGRAAALTAEEQSKGPDDLDEINGSDACDMEIGRLEEVVMRLERKYGYNTLRRAISSVGQAERTRLLLQKLLAGQPVKVSMVGGSVSAGASLSVGEKTYGGHLAASLNTLFPVNPDPTQGSDPGGTEAPHHETLNPETLRSKKRDPETLNTESQNPEILNTGTERQNHGHRLLPVCLPSAGSYVLRYCLEELLRLQCTDSDLGQELTTASREHEAEIEAAAAAGTMSGADPDQVIRHSETGHAKEGRGSGRAPRREVREIEGSPSLEVRDLPGGRSGPESAPSESGLEGRKLQPVERTTSPPQSTSSQTSATSSRTSSSTSSRAARSCDAWDRFHQSDLILVDFAVNDFVNMQPLDYPGGRLPESEILDHAESLLRKFLGLPSSPVVIFLHFCHYMPSLPPAERFFATAEYTLAKLSSYYGVPGVSVTQAFGSVMSKVDSSRRKGFPANALMHDQVHPTNEGHAMVADLTLYLLVVEFVSFLKRDKRLAQSSNSFDSEALDERANFGAQWENPQSRSSSLDANSREPIASQSQTGTPLSRSGAKASATNQRAARSESQNSPLDSRSHCLRAPEFSDLPEIPPPLFGNSTTARDPLCQFAHQWTVANGYNTSSWSLRDPEVLKYIHFGGEIKHWVSTRAGGKLDAWVDFGQHKIFGVVFRRSYRKGYKKAGAHVFVDGLRVGSLRSFWYKNHFTIWYLERNVANISAARLHTVSFDPSPEGFEVLAIVAD